MERAHRVLRGEMLPEWSLDASRRSQSASEDRPRNDLTCYRRMPDNSYTNFTEEAARFVRCVLHDNRLVLAGLRVL